MEGVNEPVEPVICPAPAGAKLQQVAQHHQKDQQGLQIVEALGSFFHSHPSRPHYSPGEIHLSKGAVFGIVKTPYKVKGGS